jgi:hypothetical protein
MNDINEAQLVAQPRAAFSLAPRNLSEAMDFAKMMADSELVPKNFRGKPADVLIAVQMGAEVGIAPIAAIQNIAVINGKPGIYGDAGKAILLANGCIIEEDDGAIVEKNARARCKITRKGRPPVERTFSLENAKTAGLWNKEGPWRNYPYRQMAWRAFWFAARDAAADLLKGLGGVEELADYSVRDMGSVEVVPSAPGQYSDEKFATNLPVWTELIVSQKKTADQIIKTVESRQPMTEEQKQKLRAVEVPSNDDRAAMLAADAALAAQE